MIGSLVIKRRVITIASVMALAISVLVAVAGTTPAGATNRVSAHKTFNCHLRSRANNRYVGAELNYTGAWHEVQRARSTTVASWEKLQCVAVGSNQWAIKSLTNHLYSTTELNLTGTAHDALRARGAAIGAWEKYTLVSVSSCACYALRSSANGLYVTTEMGYTGSLHGVLRARASKIGGWEKYDVFDDTPAAPSTLSGVSSVTSNDISYGGACAVLNSGNAWCWGDNRYGEVGNGSHTGPQLCMSEACATSAVEVKGVGGTGSLTNVQSVASAGASGSYCALLTSGGVDCWGYNGNGVLGVGTTSGPDTCSPSGFPEACSSTPVAVQGVGGTGLLSGVVQLANTDHSVCAVLNTGGVACWGTNIGGALGNGGNASSSVPLRVVDTDGTSTLSGVASLVANSFHEGYCALLTSGAVKCWGTLLSNSNAPGVPVSVAKIGGGGVLSGVANMAAVDGDGAFCATLDSGGVDCWGSNFDGNLGDGTVTDSYMTALAVRGVGGSGTLSGVISVTSTGRSVCALLAAGGVDCWGLNGSGDLGNGIAPPNFGAGPDVCNSYPCARTPAAVLGVGATGTLSGVVSLSHNREYTYCALLATGGVNCWGGGGEGTLGNGSQSVMGTSPIAVNGIGGRGTLMGVDVVTGMRGLQGGFCAIIDPSRTAACWGNSLNGALGDGSATGSTVPMPVMHA